MCVAGHMNMCAMNSYIFIYIFMCHSPIGSFNVCIAYVIGWRYEYFYCWQVCLTSRKNHSRSAANYQAHVFWGFSATDGQNHGSASCLNLFNIALFSSINQRFWGASNQPGLVRTLWRAWSQKARCINIVLFAGSVTFPTILLNNAPGVSDLIYPGKGFKCRLRQTVCEIFWGGEAEQNLNLTIITVCPPESESLHSLSGLPAPPQRDHTRAAENCGFFRKQQRAPVCNKLLGPTERCELNLMIQSYLQSFMNAVSLFASRRQDSQGAPRIIPSFSVFQIVGNII